jgi:hypothetical protein
LLWVTDDGVLFRFDDLLREPTTETGHSLVLDDAVSVRIAHPLTLGSALHTWRAVFDEAAIEQPFEQLWRTIFDGDLVDKLASLQNMKVATRELLSLKHFGWIREEPQDKGAQIALHKPLGSTEATMMVFPGFNISNANQWRHQRVVDVFVGEEDRLSAIERSELVRDLSTLKTRPIAATDSDLIAESLGFDA